MIKVKSRRKKQTILQQKGITLVSLVITIIILLILVGVAISALNKENGLITRVNQAQMQHKKSEYFEELNIEIMEEQTERFYKDKSELFILSLKEKISQKDWAKQILICDKNLNEIEDNLEKQILSSELLIITKENYEIIVNVNNIDLTAQIKEDYFEKVGDNLYRITYDKNGAEGNEIEIMGVRKGCNAILPENNFSKPGFQFVGWCENANGEGKRYTAGSEYSSKEDVTLYAIWEEKIVKVSFNSNGGTGDMETINVQAEIPTQLPINTFTKSGYLFEGWSLTASNNIDYLDGQNIEITSNITLYAVWKKNIITITFNSNGGTGTMEQVQAQVGENVNLPNNSFKKTGYIFEGWSLTANATTIQYNNSQSVSFNTNKTLYAVWKLVERYSIMTNGGIINGNNLAADALGTNAYDNNLSTYDSMIRDSNKYIYINNSVYNKNMTLYVSVGSTSDIAIYFYNKSNSIIKKHLFYTSGKSTSSWSSIEKTLINSSNIVPCVLQIPENTYKIGLQMWNTSSTVRLYNISIE